MGILQGTGAVAAAAAGADCVEPERGMNSDACLIFSIFPVALSWKKFEFLLRIENIQAFSLQLRSFQKRLLLTPIKLYDLSFFESAHHENWVLYVGDDHRSDFATFYVNELFLRPASEKSISRRFDHFRVKGLPPQAFQSAFPSCCLGLQWNWT